MTMINSMPKLGQKGIAPLLLIAVVGIIALVLISATFTFKSNLFSSLFPKPPSGAAGMVDLSLSPANVSIAPGGTLSLDINMNTNGNVIAGVTADIIVDPAKFQVVSLDNNGGILPNLFQTELPNSQHPNDAIISVGANFSSPSSASGKVATIQLRSLAGSASPYEVKFNTSGTIVSIVGGTTNFLGNTNSSFVTVTDKTASFSLVPSTTTTIPSGGTFTVQLKARSDSEAANLFSAKLQFDPAVLQVDTSHDTTPPTDTVINGVDNSGSFVTPGKFVERFSNNTTGRIAITGGVVNGNPNQGFKTSGSPATMATIYFRAIGTGNTSISFITTDSSSSNNSAIFANNAAADNILDPSASAPLSLNIGPGPSITPTPSPSPSGSANPTPTGSAHPTATPTGSGNPTPTPASSIPPTACALTSANWIDPVSNNTITSPVADGTPVVLKVVGSNGCGGLSVALQIRQDDVIVSQFVQDLTGTFVSNASNTQATALVSWNSRYIPDGIGGIFDPPDYYFLVSVNDPVTGQVQRLTSANPELNVTNSTGPCDVLGDANNDCRVDRQDLALMLKFYGAQRTDLSVDFPIKLDIHPLPPAGDGSIDTFDYSQILSILQNNGTLQRALAQ